MRIAGVWPFSNLFDAKAIKDALDDSPLEFWTFYIKLMKLTLHGSNKQNSSVGVV